MLLAWIAARRFGSSVLAEQPRGNGVTMKKKIEKRRRDELRREYGFTAMGPGVRGNYAKAYREGTNLVLLSPDVAAHFPDDQSVDAALRTLIRLADSRQRHG